MIEKYKNNELKTFLALKHAIKKIVNFFVFKINETQISNWQLDEIHLQYTRFPLSLFP